MNKRIRSMIDEIFSEMKMTAENLALRDELLSNAQARYEDAMAQGRSEEEAVCEIAASLEDMYDLLEQMNDEQQERPQENAERQMDLGDALNKAFSALGDFSQAIMPEAKKLYGQMDEVTGGVLGKLGRAARKGMRDAQKAAGEAIDRLTREGGELVFDFGADREEKTEEHVSDFAAATQQEEETQPDAPETDMMTEKPDDTLPDTELDEEALAKEVDALAREVQEAARRAQNEAQ